MLSQQEVTLMKMTSTVKWFDAKKGFGFITHPQGDADIFVHYTSIEADTRFRTLHTDEPVEFEIHDGPKGIHARFVRSYDPDWAPSEEAAEPNAALFQPPRLEQPSLLESALVQEPPSPLHTSNGTASLS